MVKQYLDFALFEATATAGEGDETEIKLEKEF